MSIAYISILVFSLIGFAVLDNRYKLVFWRDARWASITVGIGVLFFAIWDVAGIVLDIFSTGNSKYITGIMIAPDFPIEELFFLTLLCYQTLIFWELLKRRKNV